VKIEVLWNVTLCHWVTSSWYFTGAMILPDDGNCLSNDRVSRPTRRKSSAPLLRQP